MSKIHHPLFRFHKSYFFLTILLFLTEVVIALFFHDRFVRPYLGDFLVVILIYCFCKSFLKVPVVKLALSVLLFAYAVETLQYFHLVDMLGLQNSPIAVTVLGSSFEWIDMLAYTLGIGFVIFIEKRLTVRSTVPF